ncbi:MAG: hypothetical protein KME49_00190 [Brasilonema octagenarum HA4186-MV1]|jgi:hypothetical protein|uniref:DUF6644 domain-containing protein n=1 Tax=Brasilonema octagenarum UFV-OR1 TaxID=417115 RepID=A0ABX1MG31_9CYAN|nr:DUF6644 family protein [Brasilonema octagenarum]MBW4623962.1 hypothetical protein [Brasilonema octagenarum HA4186-MV1]NMF65996.1 hypothetical protein [Brasilonema octagenarum UFV-OR1]
MNLADTSWWLWLENSALSSTIRQWLWLYPMIETTHILGLAIVFGSVALFDFRLLGFSRHLLVTDMARYLLPWAYLSFAVVVLSGFLLFAVDATEIAANPAFRLKLLLLCAAGMNAAFFHGVALKSVKFWNRGVKAPVVVRAIAVISLVLWTGVIICGRLIAYV